MIKLVVGGKEWYTQDAFDLPINIVEVKDDIQSGR